MKTNCIAIATMNKVYANPVKVFIHTFKYNHPNIPINIYILDDYIPDQEILTKYTDVKFIPFKASRTHNFIHNNFVEINKESFNGNIYSTDSIIMMFAYLEVIDELISSGKHDVIIKSDLDTLWCDNMYADIEKFVKSNLPIAMSREVINEQHFIFGNDRLHYQHVDAGGYFCAGVMLFNVHLLSSSVLETVIHTMYRYGVSKFIYLDQDALVLSYKNKYVLNGVYNFTSAPIFRVNEVYCIHYNNYAKPFGIIGERITDNIRLFSTYTLYREIAEVANCDKEFIALLEDNLLKLRVLIDFKYNNSSLFRILSDKCSKMIQTI